MRVDIKGELGGAMAKSLGNDLGVHTSLKQQN